MDIGEQSYSMVLADDLDNNGHMDLLVSTMNGNVYALETSAVYHPMKAWTSVVRCIPSPYWDTLITALLGSCCPGKTDQIPSMSSRNSCTMTVTHLRLSGCMPACCNTTVYKNNRRASIHFT